MGLGCLLFQTSVCTITGRSHTGIGLIAPGGPATTSVGYTTKGVVRNGPRVPPTQRTLISIRLVGPRGSLSGRCTHLGPSVQRCPYAGSGLSPPPGLVRGIGLTVAGMLQ